MLSPANLPAGLAALFSGGNVPGAAYQAPMTSPVNAAAAEPTGMFGVKGTLRDILGTIGDSFLVQSGNNPMYYQQMQSEKRAAAMEDFVNNPLEAVKRMSQAGFGEEARKMYYDHVKDRREAMKARLDQEKTMGEITADSQKYADTVNNQIANMLGNVNWDDPQAVSAATEWARRYSSQKGVDLRIPIPEQGLNKDYAARLRESFIDPDEREKINQLGTHREETRARQEAEAADRSSYRRERLEDFDQDRQERAARAANRDTNSGGDGPIRVPTMAPSEFANRAIEYPKGSGRVWKSNGNQWERVK